MRGKDRFSAPEKSRPTSMRFSAGQHNFLCNQRKPILIKLSSPAIHEANRFSKNTVIAV
jgi:hypothetical protein